MGSVWAENWLCVIHSNPQGLDNTQISQCRPCREHAVSSRKHKLIGLTALSSLPHRLVDGMQLPQTADELFNMRMTAWLEKTELTTSRSSSQCSRSIVATRLVGWLVGSVEQQRCKNYTCKAEQPCLSNNTCGSQKHTHPQSPKEYEVHFAPEEQNQDAKLEGGTGINKFCTYTRLCMELLQPLPPTVHATTGNGKSSLTVTINCRFSFEISAVAARQKQAAFPVCSRRSKRIRLGWEKSKQTSLQHHVCMY